MELPINYNKADYKKRKAIRQEYIKRQGNKCYYCGCSLDENPCSSVRSRPITKTLFPSGFFNWPVHLHHNHKTGMTIGAVHCYCNAVLWEYEKE